MQSEGRRRSQSCLHCPQPHKQGLGVLGSRPEQLLLRSGERFEFRVGKDPERALAFHHRNWVLHHWRFEQQVERRLDRVIDVAAPTSAL